MSIRDYSLEELTNIFNSSTSYANFLNRIGYAKSSGGYRYTKKYLLSIGIDPNILINARWSAVEKTVEETFIENNYFNNANLKSKILKYNLKEYCCDICGNNGEWLGKKLSLHLDHINGINNDNRLKNLRFLCPNCHSQTDTYAGKNKKSKI